MQVLTPKIHRESMFQKGRLRQTSFEAAGGCLPTDKVRGEANSLMPVMPVMPMYKFLMRNPFIVPRATVPITTAVIPSPAWIYMTVKPWFTPFKVSPSMIVVA
jgi:hypothetical protein